MISLGINEKMILLESKRYRVVGTGKSGYRADLSIELAHNDAMGERSWHTLETIQYDRDGGRIGGQDTVAEALIDALDELMSARSRQLTAERELEKANQHIAGLEATP